jgi:hypothetical protein
MAISTVKTYLLILLHIVPYLKIILSMPSFGREVKPFAPCRRFAACKRSLNDVKRRLFGKITGPFSPTIPPFATKSARVDGDVEASDGERWERLKAGKAMANYP